jgi:hypothetical protein
MTKIYRWCYELDFSDKLKSKANNVNKDTQTGTKRDDAFSNCLTRKLRLPNDKVCVSLFLNRFSDTINKQCKEDKNNYSSLIIGKSIINNSN